MNDDTHHMKDTPTIRQGVMDAIKKGNVQMRPRWHFILISTLAALGVFIVLLTLLYLVSLSLFLLRDNGSWFAASFGGRGWFSLLRSIPWVLVLFSVVFIAILEVLVRRYRFVYRKPLLLSAVVILLVVLVGGFAIAQTSFHRQMELEAYHHQLPGPLALVSLAYGAPFRMPPPPDVYHGTILATSTDGFVMDDENGAGTTTVRITSKTRLPYGQDFSVGSEVVVIGDTVASGTVEAFGMREVDE
jgi:hypothetical protein